MIKYNLNNLIKIECYDFTPSIWYTYKKKKTFLGFVTRKEGVYSRPYDNLKIKPIKNHTVINEIIFKNPNVILTFQSNISKIYYFDNLCDARMFYNEIINNGKWI